MIDYEDFYFEFLTYQYRYYQKAMAQPERMVYKDMGIFPELVFGAGLNPVMLEIMVSIVPNAKSKTDLLEDSNQYFFETNICSYNKVALPALEQKSIPLPGAFVNATVCQDLRNNFDIMANRYQKPHLVLDYPYLPDNQVKEYLSSQYKRIFDELCAVVGEKPDYDRLKECIRLANQAVEYIEKGNEIRKGKDAIIYGGQMLKVTNIFSIMGTEESVRITKSYYDTCVQKRETKNILPCKHRLLWCNTAPIYDDNLFFHIEKDLQAVIVAEEINYVKAGYLEEGKPFDSLARRAINISFIGNVQKRIKNLVEMIREYDIDGVIFFEHQNCRMFNMNYQLIKEAVQKEGVKILKITGDCFDKTSYSKEQIMTRIEGFLEIL